MEIDLITSGPDGCIHLVEVKTWTPSDIKHPLEAISRTKRQHIRRAMLHFAADWERESQERNRAGVASGAKGVAPLERGFQFDLIWVCDPEILFYENLVT